MKPFTYHDRSAKLRFLSERVWELQNRLSKSFNGLPIHPDSIYGALYFLRWLRLHYFEDVNQLFHAAAVIEAHDLITSTKARYNRLTWFWHPTVTSGLGEADLVGKRGDKIIVSAEIKTTDEPVGTSKKNLLKAIDGLERMQGDKFLVVANKVVEKFAKETVRKRKSNIKVLSLNLRPFEREFTPLRHDL